MCMLSCFSHVWLFVTLWTVACQAPLSMGFSRWECQNGLSRPPPGESSQPKDGTCVSCIAISRPVLYIIFCNYCFLVKKVQIDVCTHIYISHLHIYLNTYVYVSSLGASPVALVVKNLSDNAGDIRCRFNLWVRKILSRRAWQPTHVFMPGESHEQRSQASYGP